MIQPVLAINPSVPSLSTRDRYLNPIAAVRKVISLVIAATHYIFFHLICYPYNLYIYLKYRHHQFIPISNMQDLQREKEIFNRCLYCYQFTAEQLRRFQSDLEQAERALSLSRAVIAGPPPPVSLPPIVLPSLSSHISTPPNITVKVEIESNERLISDVSEEFPVNIEESISFNGEEQLAEEESTASQEPPHSPTIASETEIETSPPSEMGDSIDSLDSPNRSSGSPSIGNKSSDSLQSWNNGSPDMLNRTVPFVNEDFDFSPESSGRPLRPPPSSPYFADATFSPISILKESGPGKTAFKNGKTD